METVILDTNVLLVSISSRSSLHWIFDHLRKGTYLIAVTTDILAEYAEIIEQHMGHQASEAVLGTLDNLPNVKLITTYYRFGLLSDPDDNKFVDCAVAANASYIVSHDRDFRKLRTIDFPQVEVIDTMTFKERLGA